MAERATLTHTQDRVDLPRLGFLGVGWIGQDRLKAIARSGAATVAAIADPSEEMRGAAAALAPGADVFASPDALFDADVDGIVIATPSALHAAQAIAALERGKAVFCQKPLARTADETRRVVEAARAADRLLGVDYSYRTVRGVPEVKRLIASGELGAVYAADLTFYNAYGPDKDWFYDPARSGGGCLIDLGVHLVDLALWMFDFPALDGATGRLYRDGQRVSGRDDTVEDYATALLDLAGGVTARLACSWRLPAGQDAVIEAAFYGTEGGAKLRNVDGSFYDFVVERFDGTQRERLASPPDAWGGRAAIAWAQQLARSPRFDPAAAQYVAVAAAIDEVYGR